MYLWGGMVYKEQSTIVLQLKCKQPLIQEYNFLPLLPYFSTNVETSFYFMQLKKICLKPKDQNAIKTPTPPLLALHGSYVLLVSFRIFSVASPSRSGSHRVHVLHQDIPCKRRCIHNYL